MSRRCRAELREAIIRTSLDLGRELGEEGLTMRGIASRLGVSATALYQHFESKASILREIRGYGADRLYETLAPALDLEDGRACLIELHRRYITFARENPWLYQVMMEHEQLDWSSLPAEDAARMLKPLHACQAAMERGVTDGKWSAELDLQTAAFMMWAANHGLCSLILNGRISENHPAFPIADEAAFVEAFVSNLVDTAMRAPD